MYKRSFNIQKLPPITLENFKKYSFKEYTTNYVKLVEKEDEYYLVKNIDDIIKITKNFFDFLVDEETIIVNKIIYSIPLSCKQNIIIEEIEENSTITKKANVYFETLEEALNFPIPKFFGDEIIDYDLSIDQEYVKINSNDIILLVARIKELDIDDNTKRELLSLYNYVISSKKRNDFKPFSIPLSRQSKLISLLGYGNQELTKKMI